MTLFYAEVVAAKTNFTPLGMAMKMYHLRTYHFRSAEAVRMVADRWLEYAAYLQTTGVQTHGLFRSPARPNALIALLSYEDEIASITLTSDASIAYMNALTGVDVQQIIRADDLPLNSLPFQPEQ